MSNARAVALICACALFATIASPAPPRRSDSKDTTSMAQEKTIVIRRVPNAYIYPFSLWPLPKYPIRDDPSVEYVYNGKTFKKIRADRSKR